MILCALRSPGQESTSSNQVLAEGGPLRPPRPSFSCASMGMDHNHDQLCAPPRCGMYQRCRACRSCIGCGGAVHARPRPPTRLHGASAC